MLASKYSKDDLEKQKAEHTNMENSIKKWFEELETVKRKKEDDVAWSKSAATLKTAMQKDKVLEDLTIA